MMKLYKTLILLLAGLAFGSGTAMGQQKFLLTSESAFSALGNLWSVSTDGTGKEIEHSFTVYGTWIKSLVKHPNGKIYVGDDSGNNLKIHEIDPVTGNFRMVYYHPDFIFMEAGAREMVVSSCGVIIGSSEAHGFIFSFDPATAVFTQLKTISASMNSVDLQQNDNGDIVFYDFDGLNRYNCATNTLEVLAPMPVPTVYPYYLSSYNVKFTTGSDGKQYFVDTEAAPSNFYSYDTTTLDFLLEATFDGVDDRAIANMLLMPNGKFIGIMQDGAAYGHGGVYEFDPANDTVIIKKSFLQPVSYIQEIYPYGDTIYFFLSGGGALQMDMFAYEYSSDVLVQVYDNLPIYAVSMNKASHTLQYTVDETGYYYSRIMNFDLQNRDTSALFTGEEISKVIMPSDLAGFTYNAITGKYYGLSLNNDPILYEYDPLTRSFDYKQPYYMAFNLVSAANGKLYSVDDADRIVYYDPLTNTKGIITSLASMDLSYPDTSLIAASNGLLYFSAAGNGVTSQSGIYSFDPATSAIANVHVIDTVDSYFKTPPRLFDNGNGYVYATYGGGGINYGGRLAKINLADNSYYVVHDYDPAYGYEDLYTLTFTGDGTPMGIFQQGGSGYGSIYTIDEGMSSLNLIYDFGFDTRGYKWDLHEEDNVVVLLNDNYDSDALLLTIDLSTGNFDFIIPKTDETAILRGNLDPLVIPSFSVASLPDTLYAKGSLPFNVSPLVTGTALSFQWYKNGVALTGQTANALNIPLLQLTDSGTYRLSVTDGTSTFTTNNMYLVVEDFAIVAQPQALYNICEGQAATLSITAVGASLSYQWVKDGNIVAGETATTLNLAGDLSDSGIYYCIVASGTDTLFSDSSAVNVSSSVFTIEIEGPAIVCTPGATYTYSIAASPSDTILWHNGTTTATALYQVNADTTIIVAIQNGSCEAHDTLHVTVNTAVLADTSYAYLITGDSLLFAGEYIHTSGIYADTAIVSGSGCDSIHRLIVTLGFAGDLNHDGIWQTGEIAGDANENGVIDGSEICGDVTGDGTIDIASEVCGDIDASGVIDGPELCGDINGDETIGTGEVLGDINGNGVIDFGGFVRVPTSEITGDANGNGIIDGDEIAGDINGGGLGAGELAGDANGDNAIDGAEVCGDINGNGAIDGGELLGDLNGNLVLETAEISGDVNCSAAIETGEIAGDTDGDGTINGTEICGDINGNGIIDGAEILGDANGNGVLDTWEVLGVQNGVNAENIMLYPNPANSQVFIAIPGNTGSIDITIVNFLGETVYAGRHIGTTTMIALDNIPNGAYIVDISGAAATAARFTLVVAK